jgi:hypothetical protein
LPLRRVIPADHPQMITTTAAITRRLGVGKGLLFRYLLEESPDGLPGHEGAFLLCSFWRVNNLAKQGQLDGAVELYDSLCARAGTLGLLPEQIEPSSGTFLGNYPQAFSHVGLISSGVNLARMMKSRAAVAKALPVREASLDGLGVSRQRVTSVRQKALRAPAGGGRQDRHCPPWGCPSWQCDDPAPRGFPRGGLVGLGAGAAGFTPGGCQFLAAIARVLGA